VDDVEALAREVRVRLVDLGDNERAQAQQKYMKSDMPYRGVTSPQMKILMRDVLTEFPVHTSGEWESVTRELFDNASFREERYAALGVAGHRRYATWASRLESLPLYEHMIREGAWWDIVDGTSALVGRVVRAHPGPASAVMRLWAHDETVWVRRASIICQLDAKASTDLTLLVDAITPSLGDRDFFARKAIGWALRQYARTDPEWVRAYVSELGDRLSPLSRREAMKHLGDVPR